MARGYADYTEGFGYREVVSRQNLLFDTGKAIVTESFDNPVMTWNNTGSAGGSNVIQTARMFSGPASLLVTVDNDAGDDYGISQIFGVPKSKKVGLEFVATLLLNDCKYINIYISVVLSDGLYDFRVRYDKANNKWQYYSAALTFSDIPNGSQTIRQDLLIWHRFKLTVNANTNKYMKLYVDDLEFDLSALPGLFTAGVAGTYINTVIKQTTNTATGLFYYIDNVTLTDEK